MPMLLEMVTFALSTRVAKTISIRPNGLLPSNYLDVSKPHFSVGLRSFSPHNFAVEQPAGSHALARGCSLRRYTAARLMLRDA